MCKHSDFPLNYLTIRPVKARKGYGSIAHEAKLKLWKEKAIIKLANASWRNIYLVIKRMKAEGISLPEDYY